MKKLLFISLIVATGVWAVSLGGYCEDEGEKTHQAAIPVVEALAAYAKKNGIPNIDSFGQVEGIPYELKPCSERPFYLYFLTECDVLKDGYYFHTDEGYFAISMGGIPTREDPVGFGLEISHNYTSCIYMIYKNKTIEATYLEPACSLNGDCAGWFRQ